MVTIIALRNLLAGPLFVLSLASCSREAPPPPPVVTELRVSIDAGNNCSLEGKPVECAQVAAVIRARYPTSAPRVDICLDRETRFEAATEVMQSVTSAGLPFGSFDCGGTPPG